jgi:hypothetical protein
MSSYKYNLKILLFNNNDNICNDIQLLNEIKQNMIIYHTYNIKYNNEIVPISIKWYLKKLNHIDQYFIGDLFSNSVYLNDKIIYEHTQKTLGLLEKNIKEGDYKIRFYISKILTENEIMNDKYGY